MITLRGFFEKAREGQLTGVRCTHCGELAIPPKEFCHACGKRGWELVPLSGAGTIATYTVIRVAPRHFAGEAPYAVAQVRLTEGPALLGRIVDIPVNEVAIGLTVRFRPLVADGRTSIGFGPV